MACSLPSALHPAASVVSWGVSKNSGSLEVRRQGASIDERVWRRRGTQRRPLVAAINTETASTSSSEPADQQGPPIIELQFFSPGSASDSQTFSAVSGEKNLRKFMLENKLEVYAFYGKIMNCGGGGSCGTCIVEIMDGQELLSDRTDAEYKYLKKSLVNGSGALPSEVKKPESWRLSCQTIVGDKSNSGKVVVQRLPQTK